MTPITRSLIAALLMSVLGFLAGCSSKTHSMAEQYYLVVASTKVPYFQAAEKGLNRAAAELGVRAEMTGPESYDAKGQQEEFRRIAAKKPAGILVSPADPQLLKADIDAAVAAGIPVLTVDSDSPASKRLFFIGTNNYQAGLAGGRLLARQTQGKGSFIVFTNASQANLQERLRGYEDALQTHAQMKIAEVVDQKGDPRIAFDRTTEIAEKGKPDVAGFICLTSTAGKEVADVLERKKIEGKTVMAMDVEQATLEWIDKGRIAATIAQKPFTMAYVGLKTLADLYEHKLKSLTANFAEDSLSPLPVFIDTGVTLIDKSNLTEWRKVNTPAK